MISLSLPKSRGTILLLAVLAVGILVALQCLGTIVAAEKSKDGSMSQENASTVLEIVREPLVTLVNVVLCDVKVDFDALSALLEDSFVSLPYPSAILQPPFGATSVENDAYNVDEIEEYTYSPRRLLNYEASSVTSSSLRFSIQHARPSLKSKLANALNEAAEAILDNNIDAAALPSTVHLVDSSVITNILNDECKSLHGENSIFIFDFINNKGAVYLNEDFRYAYSEFNHHHQCPSNIGAKMYAFPNRTLLDEEDWLPTEAQGCRFSWIDLSASPITYGPHSHGDGVVTELTLPKSYLTHKRASPRPQRALQAHFTSQLAAVISETAYTLYFPPLLSPTKLQVSHLSSFHDSHLHSIQTVNISETIQQIMAPIRVDIFFISESNPSLRSSYPSTQPSLDSWKALASALANLRQDEISNVSFKFHEISFDDCPTCVAAYVHSLHTRLPLHPLGSTSNNTNTVTQSTVHGYLDSEELYLWLANISPDDIRTKESILDRAWPKSKTSTPTGKTRDLPVFVFQIESTEVLLIDRSQQAVILSDMVVGIETIGTERPDVARDFHCNNELVKFQPHDASMAVAAGLFSLLSYSVPTSYIHDHMGIRRSHLWNVGSMMSSPLASSSFKDASFPFTAYDAFSRNALLGSWEILATRLSLYRIFNLTDSAQVSYWSSMSNRYSKEMIEQLDALAKILVRAQRSYTFHAYSDFKFYILKAADLVDRIVSSHNRVNHFTTLSAIEAFAGSFASAPQNVLECARKVVHSSQPQFILSIQLVMELALCAAIVGFVYIITQYSWNLSWIFHTTSGSRFAPRKRQTPSTLAHPRAVSSRDLPKV